MRRQKGQVYTDLTKQLVEQGYELGTDAFRAAYRKERYKLPEVRAKAIAKSKRHYYEARAKTKAMRTADPITRAAVRALKLTLASDPVLARGTA